MNLFLQWWWSYPDTKKMDELFFSSMSGDKKMLYIPVAMVWGYTYEECFGYISWIAKDLWISREIVMCTDMYTLPDDLSAEYCGIYIWWGNTFKLLEQMRVSGAIDKIVSFMNDWWVVCWGSAWAIIFGKDIDTSPDMNIVWMHDTKGIDILGWFSLVCHYTWKEDKEIYVYGKYHGNDVIALQEKSGIHVYEWWIMVIGDDKAYMFTKSWTKKEYLPGDSIEM